MTGFERAGGIGSPQHVTTTAGILIRRAECAVDARFVRIIMQAAHANAELPPPPPPMTCDDDENTKELAPLLARACFHMKITEKR